jgi:hypothetical protein
MTHTGACGFKTVLASSSRYGLERPVRRLAPLASAKRRDYWKWAATSPCRARLRGGCKPAQLSRLAWLRPPIRSVLAPPRPPAPAQRIGSLTLPAAPGLHPLSAPTIATGFHYQANLIARPQLFGSQMGGMFGQVMDKRTNAFFPERPNAWIPVPVLDELFA